MPSYTLNLFIASSPLAVLCGTMPRTTRQKMRLGARKWNGPRAGLTLQRFLRKSRYFTKKENTNSQNNKTEIYKLYGLSAYINA